MRISVALCTYEGARYVEQQLRSVLAQTRAPDELIVRDDGSTDGTVATVERMVDGAPFLVSVAKNDVRLGAPANFASALEAASGDVIVLCDQDDEWELDRLALVEGAFIAEPRPLAMCTNASLIDGAGRPMAGDLWGTLALSGRRRRRFVAGGVLDQQCRWSVVPGATLALRSELIPHVVPLPDGVFHDELIVLLAALLGSVVALDVRSVRYRLHEANEIGVPTGGAVARLRRRRDDSDARVRDLSTATAALSRAESAGALAARLALVARRAELARDRAAIADSLRGRLPVVLGHVLRGDYRRAAHGWRSAAHDLAFGR